jgi:hypothetical protein
MLRTTPNRRSDGAGRRASRIHRAAAAAVIAAAVIGLAACGSSSSGTTTAADLAAYQQKANAICKQAVKDISPVTTRMITVEKAKHLPTLADTTALDNAQAKLQKDLAAIPAPASAKASVDAANTTYAAIVARVKVLLHKYKGQSIAYDAVDTQLRTLSTNLATSYKQLGLTNCT